MSKAADLARTASASETALSNRNIIINGAMQISQRSVSETGITDTGYYTLDRWKSRIITMGTWTQTQSTDVPTGAGFATSLKMDCTTADGSPAATDVVQFFYGIEGQDVQQLKYGTPDAEQLTLSFWVKATKTGLNVVTLFQDDAVKSVSGTYTISTSNTWEYKTLTFVGNTADVIANDNTRGLLVIWELGAGSNRTSGTLKTTWTDFIEANESVGQVNNADSTSNDWLITGVQLEVGPVATPFEHRSFGQELALCERYCTVYKTNGEGQIPHSSATVDVANRPELLLLYPKKRANPSIAVVNPTNFKLLTAADTAVAATGYGGTYLGTGPDSAIMFWNVSSGVATNALSGVIQQLLIFQNTGSITIDAEL